MDLLRSRTLKPWNRRCYDQLVARSDWIWILRVHSVLPRRSVPPRLFFGLHGILPTCIHTSPYELYIWAICTPEVKHVLIVCRSSSIWCACLRCTVVFVSGVLGSAREPTVTCLVAVYFLLSDRSRMEAAALPISSWEPSNL